MLRLPTPLARAAVPWLQLIAGRNIDLLVTDIPALPRRCSSAARGCGARFRWAPPTANVPLGVAAPSCAGMLCIGVDADAVITDPDVLGHASARGFATLAVARREST